MSIEAREMAFVYDRTWKDFVCRASRSKRRRIRLPPVEPDNEKLVRSEEVDEELFSGIGNEITFIHILPKLPWRAFLVLSSVCRCWKQALQPGHRYYEGRVRSNLTETLAVVDVTLPDEGSHTIALYSVRDGRLYYVPPIPCFKGFPLSYECVAVDGKLYVLGGTKVSCTELISKEVYVLDLVGKRQWRQCASMRKLRHQFRSGVSDGKIYVFGGDSTSAGEEVYDPKLDSWSPIRYDGVSGLQHQVKVGGEELLMYGGWIYKREWELRDWGLGTSLEEFPTENVLPPHVEVDNNVKKPFVATVVVDHELLAVMNWVDTETWIHGPCLVRSRGYSPENSKIAWEKAPCSNKHNSPVIYRIRCSIQL